MSSELSKVIYDIVPYMYEVTVEQLRLPSTTDMSHSNRCDRLTLNMLEALNNRHLATRREQHETGDGRWHYMLAHTAPGTTPAETDIVTDLNPWQYEDRRSHSGALHGPRHEVEAVLARAGAPEWFVSLRGLATITEAHTTMLAPRQHSANAAIN